MVSFSCENCGDVLTKKKLDGHRGQCRGASFTCLDCMVHFKGTEYRSHTSCISEAQKYEGKLFKGDKKKAKPHSPTEPHAPLSRNSQALVPRNAFVEDAPDAETGAVAIVEVIPRAPTPPPAARSLPPTNFNVFDFMVDETAHVTVDENKMIADDEWQDEDAPMEELFDNHDRLQQELEDKMQAAYQSVHLYEESGFEYGDSPIQPTFDRWNSTANLLAPPPEYAELKTPAPKPTVEFLETRAENDTTTKKSTDKKRKRAQIEDLDLTLARHGPEDEVMRDADGLPTPAMLHTGLTGGLSKMLSRSNTVDLPSPDYAKTPISPMKRTKHSIERPDKLNGNGIIREKERGREREAKTKKATSKTEVVRVRKSRRSRESPERPPPAQGWVRRRRSDSETREVREESRQELLRKKHLPREQPPSSMKMIEYRPGSVSSEELSMADMFMSLVSKGPDSDRGISLHKCLKKWRSEIMGSSSAGSEGERDLWRTLRLRRNERGEIVMFV